MSDARLKFLHDIFLCCPFCLLDGTATLLLNQWLLLKVIDKTAIGGSCFMICFGTWLHVSAHTQQSNMDQCHEMPLDQQE